MKTETLFRDKNVSISKDDSGRTIVKIKKGEVVFKNPNNPNPLSEMIVYISKGKGGRRLRCVVLEGEFKGDLGGTLTVE